MIVKEKEVKDYLTKSKIGEYAMVNQNNVKNSHRKYIT